MADCWRMLLITLTWCSCNPNRESSMNPQVEPLFTPLTVRGLTLRNRIVMSPMTRNFSPQGVPGPDVAAYYRRRAAGETGLLITEGVGIDHPAALGAAGL